MWIATVFWLKNRPASISITGYHDGQAAETPRVDALTGICSSAAGRMATARSTALATLKGYDNRAKRDERVAVIMTDIQVPADILDKISTSCSRSLS
ncbi:hypothetical protein CN177_24840 [Sinorhizobium meliloti]|nr:hypothetical protein [Sinorhizobium meliloti]RVG78874.1 hypothetical protein CN219_27665 [Sinorhizobium meliloti]RVI34744.1 hypothetical protein CN197_15510 [Sinorhizobium meliloti]RVI45595.1 hypothetical protein CN196_12495 [Sinorhizobium meliloti]RVJ19864.1 hypothetical protein CN177_24840 [Sinorhizobium meliloti]